MISFEMSPQFKRWLSGLNGVRTKAKILTRLKSAEFGNFGDCSPIGEGVSEMRIHYGPGYRVYFMRKGEVVYLLLSGGDKSSQNRDIRNALEMSRTIRRMQP
jgi:putative addiction module killer protein